MIIITKNYLKKENKKNVQLASSQAVKLKQKHFVSWNMFFGIPVALPAAGIEVSDKAEVVCNFLLCKTIKTTVTFLDFNRQTGTDYCTQMVLVLYYHTRNGTSAMKGSWQQNLR